MKSSQPVDVVLSTSRDTTSTPPLQGIVADGYFGKETLRCVREEYVASRNLEPVDSNWQSSVVRRAHGVVFRDLLVVSCFCVNTEDASQTGVARQYNVGISGESSQAVEHLRIREVSRLFDDGISVIPAQVYRIYSFVVEVVVSPDASQDGVLVMTDSGDAVEGGSTGQRG